MYEVQKWFRGKWCSLPGQCYASVGGADQALQKCRAKWLDGRFRIAPIGVTR